MRLSADPCALQWGGLGARSGDEAQCGGLHDPGDRERTWRPSREGVGRLAVEIEVAGDERRKLALAVARRVERSPVHRARDVEDRLDRVDVLAPGPARLVAVPDRDRGDKLDVGCHGLLVEGVVELVAQRPDPGTLDQAVAAQDAGAVGGLETRAGP